MVNIPAKEVTQADLEQWYHLQDQLKRIKTAELLLRQKIFGTLFPSPKEGTNDVMLEGGYVLKGKHTISREIDVGALASLHNAFGRATISVDSLINYKPSLVLKEYRTLTEEQRHLFDQCLIIKPGSPSLEIVMPAKSKKAGETA